MRRILFLLAGAVLAAPLMAAPGPALDIAATPDAAAEDALPIGMPDDVMRLPDFATDSPARASGGSGLLPGARFTVTQELAARIREPYGVANNRSSLRMEYEKHFLDSFYLHYDLIGTAFWSNDHRAEARDTNAFTEGTVRDAYLQFSKGNTSVKLGRQILIWGESDAGAITDVISPRDLSELFFISLEKSRISQLMLTVDQFSSVGDWSFFYVPKAKFNKYPESGDIYSLDPFGGAAETVTAAGYRGEFGLRWRKTFGRSDVGLMAARLVDNDYVIRQDGFTSDGRPLLRRETQRFDMVGATFNRAGGGFLFSGEFARKSPVAFSSANGLPAVRKDVVDTSLRLEYSLGNGGNHAVSLEAVNRHVLDWDREILPTPRSTNTLVLGWRNSFLNETLTTDWMTVYNATYTSFTHSLFTSYKLNDRVSLGLDLFYLSVKDQRNELYPYRGQNAAVFRVSYQF